MKVFGKISLLFANSMLGDKHNCGHVLHTNIDADILPQILKVVKFVNQGTSVYVYLYAVEHFSARNKED